MDKKNIFAVASLLATLIFAAPSVFAATNALSLSVDPSAGSTDKEYTFTVTWDTNAGIPDFKDVSLQYKKNTDPDSAWTTYSSTTGNPRKLTLSDTFLTPPGPGTLVKSFKLVPSLIDVIPGSIESRTFSDTYFFRMLDAKYVNKPDSSVASIAFGNKCTRRSQGTLKTADGTGYRVVSASDVIVDVSTGRTLGSGTFVAYDFRITNADVGCGATSSYVVDVLESGVTSNTATKTVDGESKTLPLGPRFKVISLTNPDGGVAFSPGNSLKINPGGTATLRIEVEAAENIQPGVKAYSVVTFRATNVDAQNEGISSKVELSGRITANELRECKTNAPTVKLDPAQGRSGFPGDTLDFLVTVANQNLGNCNPETFTITQAGVLEINPRNSNGEVLSDEFSWKWGVVARQKKGGNIVETRFANTGKTSTFTYAGADYVRFVPSGLISFTLGNFDDKISGTNVKTLILKVTSNAAETKPRLASIAVCLDKNNVCAAKTYTLLNIFTDRRPTNPDGTLLTNQDLKPPITDGSLTSQEAAPVAGGSPTTGGTPKGTVPGTVEGIDTAFLNKCKACTVGARVGWNADTGTCIEGFFEGSAAKGNVLAKIRTLDNRAHIDKNNWIFYPTVEAKNKLLTDPARNRRAYTCETPPPGVGMTSASGTAGSTPGWGAGGQISVRTGKDSYNVGELLDVSGSVAGASGSVEIEFIAPSGASIGRVNRNLDSSGAFGYKANVPELNIGSKGTWKIVVRYGTLQTEKTFTVVVGSSASSGSTGGAYQVTVSADKSSYSAGDLAKFFGSLKQGASGVGSGTVSLEFVQPSGSSVGKTAVVTRSDGSFAYSANIPVLPNGASRGSWKVIASYPAGSAVSESTFSVN